MPLLLEQLEAGDNDDEADTTVLEQNAKKLCNHLVRRKTHYTYRQALEQMNAMDASTHYVTLVKLKQKDLTHAKLWRLSQQLAEDVCEKATVGDKTVQDRQMKQQCLTQVQTFYDLQAAEQFAQLFLNERYFAQGRMALF